MKKQSSLVLACLFCLSFIFSFATVRAQSACTPFFQFTLGQCPTILFFDGSSCPPGSSINGWSWDFGDGTGSSIQNPSHTYSANGLYLVCLTISDNAGRSATYCDTINISCIQPPACSAAFQWTFGPTTACPFVEFTDYSTISTGDSIVGWSWNFGDGGFSSQQNPIHQYTANGDYVACLSIQTISGCINTFCDTVSISCIQPLTCTAGYQYTLGACPAITFFGFGNSSQTGDTAITYSWNFGDGTSAMGVNPTHTYTQNGSYVACLFVIFASGCQATYCDTLNINCIQPPVCNANFQWAPNPNLPCQYIDFTDLSTSSTGDSIVSWNWIFGDGGNSNQQNPTHFYSNTGSYLACLVIQTASGCTNTYCDTVNVNCPPTCTAGYQYTLGACPDVSFFGFGNSSQSGDTAFSYNWNFGDGTSATGMNATHTYTQNGSYVACLFVIFTSGCQATYCDTINISCIQPPNCGAGFQWTFGPNGCPTVQFTDYSSSSPGTITSWSWDFGDGNTSAQQNPLHAYSANGSYLVCLDILSSDSCTATFCDTVRITCIQQSVCQAAFQWSGANTPTIAFYDASTATPGNIISWSWSFGDGGTSVMQNPVYTYANDGDYIACLTISTDDNCTSTYCDTVVIRGTVGMTELTDLNQVRIYPVPAREVLNIEFTLNSSEFLSLELADLTGKILREQEITRFPAGDHSVKVEVKTLSPGMYFLRIQGENGTLTRKVLIER